MREFWWCAVSGSLLLIILTGWTSAPVQAASLTGTRACCLIEGAGPALTEGLVTLSPGTSWTSPALPPRADQEIQIVLRVESGAATLAVPAAQLMPIVVVDAFQWQRRCVDDPIQMVVSADAAATAPVIFRWQLSSISPNAH